MTFALVTLAATMAWLKIVGTLIFLAIFLGIVIWLLMSRSDKYSKTEQIPLHDDKVMEPRNSASGDETQHKSGTDHDGER